ncbi:alkaline ceramidase 3 [Mucor mucedo]|uniref:alkaline ceramidase 3 n=1 Tax=Mucor mucedo TaxID=29922 RepID=UPI0022206291|nr:alkaline ceramidase 3 [Mucor mucedo]KAI7891822.1 alkaline ceramidase 3 [Mucor mucedo]
MHMKDYYWGPVTSTIDWCEENYTVSPYIAEFFNTVTNLSYILLSLFGVYNVYHNKTSKTVYLSYLGIMFVGFGSWCFHMTLQYNMQLLDELPMLYIACIMLWHTFIADPSSTIGAKLPIGLAIYSILVSYAYIIINDPVFHQVAYGTLVVTVVCRAILLLNKVPAQRYLYERAQMKTLLILAAAGFIVGFTLWNIDNIFCLTLRDWRKTVPTLTGSVSELHGWWHIGTALGAYYFIVFCEWIRPVLYNKNETYRLYWIGPICYLRPTSSSDMKAKST